MRRTLREMVDGARPMEFRVGEKTVIEGVGAKTTGRTYGGVNFITLSHLDTGRVIFADKWSEFPAIVKTSLDAIAEMLTGCGYGWGGGTEPLAQNNARLLPRVI